MTSRALVCEAVARACVEKLDNQESWTILSARFATVDEDGEETLPLSGELSVLCSFRAERVEPALFPADDLLRAPSSVPFAPCHFIPIFVTTTALETAVDQSASHFLSSSTCQNCVFALWRGLLVQKNIGDDEGGIAGIQYQLVSRRTPTINLMDVQYP